MSKNHSVMLALTVLHEHISKLNKVDQDNLLELMGHWSQAKSSEEIQSIFEAIKEILLQNPITPIPFNLNETPMPLGLQQYADNVGKRIAEAREKSGMTQTELATRSNLPQSHISRIENSKHNPTYATLLKISRAIGQPLSEIIPWL